MTELNSELALNIFHHFSESDYDSLKKLIIDIGHMTLLPKPLWNPIVKRLSTSRSSHSFFKFIHLRCLYNFNMKCPTGNLVLNSWSPEEGTYCWRWRKLSRLAYENGCVTGGMFLHVPQDIPQQLSASNCCCVRSLCHRFHTLVTNFPNGPEAVTPKSMT